MTRITSLLVTGGALAAISTLHHGHIAMFLTDVHEILSSKRGRWRRRGTITQESSKLFVRFEPSAQYAVSVHRLTRSVDVALLFEGSRDHAERWVDAIAARSTEIGAKLGANVELERTARTRARIRESHIVSGDDWSPKRDLTPALARVIARRLLRFIDVLER